MNKYYINGRTIFSRNVKIKCYLFVQTNQVSRNNKSRNNLFIWKNKQLKEEIGIIIKEKNERLISQVFYLANFSLKQKMKMR